MKLLKSISRIIIIYLLLQPVFGQNIKPDYSKVPGTVIAHSPSSSGFYIGSPSLCILPDGTYIASHDLFGPKLNKINTPHALIYESLDKGKTWNKIAEFEQFWSNLFYYQGALYFMGTKNQWGDVVIRKSIDKGHHWTEPSDESNGVLLRSGKSWGYHTSAVPMVFHEGRIWRAMESAPNSGPWGGFKAFMMSAKEDSNLLKASSWTSTNTLDFNDSWKQGNEWLEGNAVVSPTGEVVNILRVNNKTDDVAAVIKVSSDSKSLSFDPETGFINLPGACKKFSIRKHPKTNIYYTLTNAIPQEFKGGNVERTRNTLYLLSSDDMIHWKKKCIILQGDNVAKHGFQYVDWQFDGKDIVFVSRTAYEDGLGGADNQHNANFLTFHRIKKYKSIN
jgi:signal peptidase I